MPSEETTKLNSDSNSHNTKGDTYKCQLFWKELIS